MSIKLVPQLDEIVENLGIPGIAAMMQLNLIPNPRGAIFWVIYSNLDSIILECGECGRGRDNP
jgi:hypothetical protein